VRESVDARWQQLLATGANLLGTPKHNKCVYEYATDIIKHTTGSVLAGGRCTERGF
jgi:hypothetical protein